jgi:SAM-dependent methyltransferase
MKPGLLEYLVCAICRGDLRMHVVHQALDGEVLTGTLTCRDCSHRFEICGGVPRMIPRPVSNDSRHTADCFGWEWQRFETDHGSYEEALFLDWVSPFTRESFAGKVVLDAGCGTGRHSRFAAGFGAKDVIAIDLSAAVDAAYQAIGALPNCHVAQADIYQLPFRTDAGGPFELIYSIGVLHHTPDPRRAFLSLARHIKPGGSIFAWVYGHEGNAVVHYLIDPIRTAITSRLPRKLQYHLSFLLAAPLQLLLRGVYKPANETRGLRWLAHLLYYNSYLYHISKFTLRHNQNIVFDHLSAPTAFYIRGPEFRDWFEAAELLRVGISSRNQNSWRGWGTRPGAAVAGGPAWDAAR